MSISAFAMQDSPALQAARPRHSTAAHAGAPQQQDGSVSATDLEKYKPLLEELGRLEKKIQQNVQVPPAITQSRLLPVLPSSSSFYVSLPNYGETLHQVNQIFLDELKESPELNDWWQNKAGMVGMMVEEGIDKFYQFTQYLGNEIVVTGNVNSKGPSVLVIAQTRKPGLKAFVDQIIKQYAPQPQPPVRVLTPAQLLTAKTQGRYKPLLVLVRPDFVVVTTDLPTLRAFNAQLNRGGGRFGATPFGQRVAQAYSGGAQSVIGVDLQKLMALRPQGNPMSENAFQQSGFADLKYLILDSKYAGGSASSDMELSFTGPRHGIASWLASPGPLPGLDFVSPNAAYSIAFLLKNPAQIFDEAKQMAESVNPMAGGGVDQAETALKIKLKEDLFSKLGGQLTFAVDGAMDSSPIPPWKAIVQVSDPNGLQQTIQKLLAAANENAGPGKATKLEQQREGGLTYYNLHFGDGPKAAEVHYAFTDGFMVVGGSHAIVKDAVGLHQSGKSLSKSTEFQSLVPPEHSYQASALLYENPALFLTMFLRQAQPGLLDLFHPDPTQSHGVVAAAYAEDTVIRSISKSQGIDAGVIGAALVVAAVAIPNIMRSKTVANEASAAATVKMVNTAQAQYITEYDKGYAPDLGTLASCGGNPTADHACLIEDKLGCSGTWCVKNGFRYSLTGTCMVGRCDNYVIVATPLNPNDGGKNFCSTSDAVVRSQTGSPLTAPITVNQCESWSPI